MRNEEQIATEYELWLSSATADKDLIPELKAFTPEQKQDAFYRNLTFGTGGLRGTIGAGTNRMNVYTVARATRGLAAYLLSSSNGENEIGGKSVARAERAPSVVIGYDSRIKSLLFAQTTAAVLHNLGVKVWMWNRLLPVPTVSFAVRYLHASAGVMITASHNPSKYNGYKVYGSDGCQITTSAASSILERIEECDYFGADGLSGEIPTFTDSDVSYIDDYVLDSFIECVKKQSVLGPEDDIDRDVSIVYTPLNGTGLEPVTRVLRESGFTNIHIVEEQKNPDGNFSTCPYPNPEIPAALELGLRDCKRYNADLLIATDPDCDRCGIAVRSSSNDSNGEPEYQLLTGNETGLLLFDFICSQRIHNHTMPAHPVMIKTIVTSDMGEQIAKHYGVSVVNVLTGFKFIGEQIGRLESFNAGKQEDEQKQYIFGFEESYGYLTGSYVRDKDGVDAAYMIAEMFSYYHTHGVSLLEKLEELYKKYGYRLNTLHSYEFDGESGMLKMQDIMKRFHGITTEDNFAGVKINAILDYSKGLDGLPKSDVLKYKLSGNSYVVVRPSGTEPKLKVYISIASDSMSNAKKVEEKIATEISGYMK